MPRPARPTPAGDEAPVEEVGRHVGVLLDAGEHRRERRDAEIVGALRRRADEDDVVADPLGADAAVEDVAGRDVPEGPTGARVVHEAPRARVDRDRDAAEPHGAAEVELQREGIEARRHAHGLEREARVVVAA